MVLYSLHQGEKSSINGLVVTTYCCDVFVILDPSKHIIHSSGRYMCICINNDKVISLYNIYCIVYRSNFSFIDLVLEKRKSIVLLFKSNNFSRIISTLVIDNIQGYIFMWITSVY